MGALSPTTLYDYPLGDEAFKLYKEIKRGSFIQIKKTDPSYKEIKTLFKQLLLTNQGTSLIKKIKTASKGKPPLEIENSTIWHAEARKIEINLNEKLYLVVLDTTSPREPKIETASAMIALFHELVHVLDITLENKTPLNDSKEGLLFSSDFDDFQEYVAIQLGVDGHSENALREELNAPIRVNHRGCDFSPFSKELASKNDAEKIKALQAYVEVGASTDAKLMMQHIPAENIAKSGILESAVKLKYWSIVFKLLEVGKDQWTPKQLKKVLRNVIRNGGHENFKLIFNARRGKWPLDALESALRLAGKLWEKEIFKLLFIEGQDQWSFDTLAWALEMAITVKMREKFGFGKGVQKEKWETEPILLILNSRRGKWPFDLLTHVLEVAKANKEEEICRLISAATQKKSP